MIYGVLGELEVRDPRSGMPLELPPGRQLNVLAALLIQPNKRLPQADLLRMGWGRTDVAEAQLHKAVSGLRTLLRRVGRDGDLITHARFGYELRAGAQDHDLLAFDELTGAAEKRTDDEVELLSRALRLWRGPQPLSNISAPWAGHRVQPLQQRRKRIAVRLFTVRMQRGEFGDVLDELQPIAAQFSPDHHLQKLLMIALHHNGHRTEAVESYEQYAQALDARIGDVDAELRSMAYAISSGRDDQVAKVFPLAAHPVRAVAAVPQQLPAAPPEFVGREALVAELTWLLGAGSSYQVMVVPGPGGIGKTSLALHAAHQRRSDYPDGQLWAELRGTSTDPATPAEILAQFLRSLNVSTVPDSPAERAALYRSLLADRRMLVVLDDAADGAQIAPLIPAGAGCKVLVTARRHLPDVRGAHHVGTLDPLLEPDATALFESVVAASRINLDGEREAVSEVVRLCGGLPLALRIAAALRVHDHPHPTAELARRLRTHGPAAYAFGADSLARTLETGLAPLTAAQQRLFVDLGLLPLPTFGAWTAATLTGDAARGRAALAELAAASMVETTATRRPRRFRFHDLTREYAARRAEAEYPDPRSREELLGRVCAALLSLLRHAHARQCGGDFDVVHGDVAEPSLPADAYAEVDDDPLAWFRAERLNVRAAVGLAADLGLTDLCWDLAVSAHEFYTILGLHDDWYATHTTALQACRSAGDRRGEGIVLACLGQPALATGGRRPGIPGIDELSRAVELLEAEKEVHGLAIARRTLANAVRRRGRSTEALTLFTAALHGYQASGDTAGRWQTLRFIGQVHLDRGEYAQAAGTLARAEEVAVELGHPRFLAQTRYWVGCAALAVGDLAGAQRAFTMVSEAFGPDDGVGFAYAMHGLGDLARHRGDRSRAKAQLLLAAQVAHDRADSLLEGRVRLSLALLWHDDGRPGDQVSELDRAACCFAGADAAYLEIQARSRLAAVLAAQGPPEVAHASWSRVEQLYEAGDVPAHDRVTPLPPAEEQR
ncbi:SARP family transcriptional regulator [Actinoplanes cyaneus]|uniref:SARP family transcriptional regulator n=1 Tax=Actinoplanes cyaneus TaxID=52696 RepID=A0A919IT18_9ACTN|nr:BTAD domain-containing putative transcriptional regulator [Actinoplanes cyaneus]MCW2144057.1 DNA-binding transcriptional activator of the SARP family [Actinoplanes cyaneus]GID70726.1 SARP family transcriptional regulator [Actinoplanes cyaneus]